MADPISSVAPKLYTPIDEPPPPSPKTPKTVEAKKPAVNLDAAPAPTGGINPAAAYLMAKPSAATTSTTVTTGTSSTDAKMSLNVGSWPIGMLEREGDALRLRMMKDPSGTTGADKQKLADIEGELSKRYEAIPKLAPVTSEKKGVELCERPADIIVVRDLGIPHRWLKTTTKEAGMGIAGGKIPGHDDKDGPSSGGFLGKTELVDHTGESNLVESVCTPRPDLDEDCVDKELAIGKPEGRWFPALNDCHVVVADIEEKCSKTAGAP